MTPHTNQVEPTDADMDEQNQIKAGLADELILESAIAATEFKAKLFRDAAEYIRELEAAAPQQQDRNLEGVAEFLMAIIYNKPIWPNSWGQDVAMAAFALTDNGTRATYKPAQQQGEPVAMARKFHETYERLAPKFGYETRKDTREFDENSANGRLMIAVCGEIFTADASFNQGIEAALNECKAQVIASNTAYQKATTAKDKQAYENAVIGASFCHERIESLKRPTDMVTMTRDELEEMQLKAKRYDWIRSTDDLDLLGDLSTPGDLPKEEEFDALVDKSIVSRALEGK